MKKIILFSVLAFFLFQPSFSQQDETHVNKVSPDNHSSDIFFNQDSLSQADLKTIIRKFEKPEGIHHFNNDSILHDRNNLITGLIQREKQYGMPVVKPKGEFYLNTLKPDSSSMYYLIIKDPLQHEGLEFMPEP